ncbi:unnamed protein product [Parnassius apollo]|uniref:(apollo) hypothetical protein n=1 Tax=Parnassius apollo TaxID=110799 RepID=A0A8S3WNL9_PARAO|nr:unnamed protein product [Parnassius apollo]
MHRVNKRCRKMLDLSFQNAQEVVDQNNSASLQEKKNKFKSFRMLLLSQLLQAVKLQLFKNLADDSYAPNSSDLETDSSYSDDSDSDDSVITYYENSSETELVQILENTQCTENNNFDEWEDINDTKLDFDEFTDNCRPNIPDNTITPADFYSLFVTDEIIEQMVINTNNCAQDLISNLSNLKPKSRLRAWTPTTPEEMKKFLGVLLAMGLVRIPRLNDYWSKRNIYNNKYISSVMTRDRFLLILIFWHFSQESPNDTDKLKKDKGYF